MINVNVITSILVIMNIISIFAISSVLSVHNPAGYHYVVHESSLYFVLVTAIFNIVAIAGTATYLNKK